MESLIQQLERSEYFNQLKLEDKEKYFRSEYNQIKNDLFHKQASTGLKHYIDPRIVFRFFARHQLRPGFCGYTVHIMKKLLWATKWASSYMTQAYPITYLRTNQAF